MEYGLDLEEHQSSELLRVWDVLCISTPPTIVTLLSILASFQGRPYGRKKSPAARRGPRWHYLKNFFFRRSAARFCVRRPAEGSPAGVPAR
jgi:hypothetical protein